MEIEEYNWVKVRTNKGEWISDIHIEILCEDEVQVFESLALEEGKELDKHYGYYEDTSEQFVWCYKNDIEELIKSVNNSYHFCIFTGIFVTDNK